jgi:hypothetical protein
VLSVANHALAPHYVRLNASILLDRGALLGLNRQDVHS